MHTRAPPRAETRVGEHRAAGEEGGGSGASYNKGPVDTKLAASGPKPDEEREQRPGTDIRASRLYLFSRRPLIGALRRALSVALLVAVDILGLALGLYIALVLRTVLYGDTVYWSLLWRAGPREWLPFLIPVTVLVFLQAGLYARREHRAGVGRVVSSLILVALIILSVGARHRLRLHDDRADPDGGRHVLARDRPPPRRLLVVRARADEGGGHPPQGRPRRRGPQPREAPSRAACDPRRPRLRVSRRRLALGGRGPAAARPRRWRSSRRSWSSSRPTS